MLKEGEIYSGGKIVNTLLGLTYITSRLWNRRYSLAVGNAGTQPDIRKRGK